VHLVGIAAYQALLIDLCEREAPDVLVTHPPYDWLTLPVADRLRAAGARLVGYAFDDEIFASEYGTNVRAEIGRVYDRYVTTAEVRWATAPQPAVQPRPPEHDVALVGRAYSRRVALVKALRAAGLRVATAGLGWPEGFVSRTGLRELYARAAVVVTTADWEARAVPMVKHRLLDTAMLGAFQIAQEAPDLRAYFSDEEVPSFRDADELVARVRAALANPERRRASAERARRRALDEHTWRGRFPQLIGGLVLGPERPRPGRSALHQQILLALGSRAEADGRVAAAAALYRERLACDPSEPTAAAGLGRCLRDLGDLEGALPWLQRAARAPAPTLAGAVHAALPAFGVGAGLGRLGLLPPQAEPTVLWVAALADLGRLDEAAAVVQAIDSPALARAVSATLRLGDAEHLAPLRAALQALASRAGQ
jgi:tetratricopeptide (TPR) repeat protein